MSKINYVYREDGMPQTVFSEESFIELEAMLSDYPYLIDSINEEDYYIENGLCLLFNEIVSENKVVGFATYEFRDETMLLSECYILPEFRGRGLFFDELCKMVSLSGKFGILQPTGNVVDLLVEYSYARELNDDIVASGIEFYFDEIDAVSYKKKTLHDETMDATRFYDRSIKSAVYVGKDDIIYHELLENDLKRYGARKNLDESYFTGIRNFFADNDFDNIIEELEENMPKILFGYDEIIGEGEGLSDFMQHIVDEGLIDRETALKIRGQLIEEYQEGKINDDNIDERFNYLISLESFDEDEEMIPVMDLIGENPALSSEIFDAVMNDDYETFEKLMLTAMVSDEKFAESIFDMMEEIQYDEHPLEGMIEGPFGAGYKLKDMHYGRDSPFIVDNYLFIALTSIKKHNSIKTALKSAEVYETPLGELIEETMFSQNLVEGDVTYDNWDKFAKKNLKVNDLRNILNEYGLKSSGKKQKLIDRIAENRIPLSRFNGDTASITPEGEEFLDKTFWIQLYADNMTEFDFTDYSMYLEDRNGDLVDVTLEYLEEHMKKAEEENDPEYISECQKAYDAIQKMKQ